MIFFPDNKTCSYEIEYEKDCCDAEFERVKKEWGEE
jgi:hypothetical protein